MRGCLSPSTRDGAGTSPSVEVRVAEKGTKGQCQWVTVFVAILVAAVWGLRID